MKLLMVHPDARLPSARIRLAQTAPHLEELGAEVECVQYPKGLRSRRELASEMERFDLVLVHHKLPSLQDGHWWSDVSRPLVFDFDDAVVFRDRPRRGSWESRTRRRRFARIRRIADGFTCGNRYLESLVADTGKPTRVVPSPVPLDVPRRGEVQTAGPPRIGWIGGRGNLASLEALADVLRELATEREFVLTVISDAPLELAGGPTVENVRWTLDGQERELARLDVGVMPLEDTPWNRGKCAYKLLQYMAAEVAALASPVGMNAELIRSGQNGLLADAAQEWLEGLRRLIDDTRLRRGLGREGRRTVEADYGYQTVARGLFGFLVEILDSRKTYA